MFKFQTTINENHILLELSGRLMIYEDAQKMQNKIINELNDTKNIVVICFKDLEYLNSSGLSALITILTKSRNLGGETIITNIPNNYNYISNSSVKYINIFFNNINYFLT